MAHKKPFSKHLPHYIPLIGILTAGFLAFWVFSYDKGFQAGVLLSVSIGHITWGIMHHLMHGDLTLGVALEYVAVALLGVAVVFSLLLR